MALVRSTVIIIFGICAFAASTLADSTQDIAIGYDAYTRGDFSEAAVRFLEARQLARAWKAGR